MTNYRDKDKNTNKQRCRTSPCLGLALQAYKFPSVEAVTAFQKQQNTEKDQEWEKIKMSLTQNHRF